MSVSIRTSGSPMIVQEIAMTKDEVARRRKEKKNGGESSFN
jgi:hypothetical protein